MKKQLLTSLVTAAVLSTASIAALFWEERKVRAT
jgi:hypothetical protein